MGFLDGLRSLFTGGSAAGGSPLSSQGDGGYYIYVRCNRCKEAIRTRINLRNDLSARDEGGYTVTKTLVGSSGRCFQRIEVTLMFDGTHRVVDQQIAGGEFIPEKEYQAAQPPSSQD